MMSYVRLEHLNYEEADRVPAELQRTHPDRR